MIYEEFLKRCNEQINVLSDKAMDTDVIENELYAKYKVFRGLRDSNGVGVVTGLTDISEVNAYKGVDENGERIPIEGELFYRGINIYSIVEALEKEDRFGFEEVCYLLLCGELPNAKELEDFNNLLAGFRSLPDSFVRDVVLKAPSKNIMNAMSRCVLTLYSYDSNADDISVRNVFRQSLQLIAQMPLLAVYCYQSYKHYILHKNLVIRLPKPEFSTAENILYMLKGTGKYNRAQALMLDRCLILQMEHGGGNNSTFTAHVVTSTGTDTYSTITASLGSLKGPRHGGANVKVAEMMEDIKENIPDMKDETIMAYLRRMLNKEVFDRQGLIYGVGHAIYSLSDPRANIMRDTIKDYAKTVPDELEDYELYTKLAKLAPRVVAEKKSVKKPVPINVDFYSNYVYKICRIPEELFTPMFAVARVAGWSAHRLEEIVNKGKIIRPAYIAVQPQRHYRTLKNRK